MLCLMIKRRLAEAVLHFLDKVEKYLDGNILLNQVSRKHSMPIKSLTVATCKSR